MGIPKEQIQSSACPEGVADKKSVAPGTASEPETSEHGSASLADDSQIVRWVEDAQEGDRDAFENLVLHFQDRVWRRALYRLGDQEEAHDLAQDVFLTCWRKIGQFRGESKFWSWLGRIVDNLAKNRQAWLSRRGKEKTLSLDEPPSEGKGAFGSWELPDPAPGPRKLAENQEAMEALQRNLGLLSAEHREVLLMRFADGLSYEEIAETLEISMGTIKSRINRARSELRSLMGDFLK